MNTNALTWQYTPSYLIALIHNSTAFASHSLDTPDLHNVPSHQLCTLLWNYAAFMHRGVKELATRKKITSTLNYLWEVNLTNMSWTLHIAKFSPACATRLSDTIAVRKGHHQEPHTSDQKQKLRLTCHFGTEFCSDAAA